MYAVVKPPSADQCTLWSSHPRLIYRAYRFEATGFGQFRRSTHMRSCAIVNTCTCVPVALYVHVIKTGKYDHLHAAHTCRYSQPLVLLRLRLCRGTRLWNHAGHQLQRQTFSPPQKVSSASVMCTLPAPHHHHTTSLHHHRT